MEVGPTGGLPKDSAFTPKQLLAELEAIRSRTQPGDTILFFFAGHGTSVEGESYLVLPGTDADDIPHSAVRLRDVSGLLRIEGSLNVRIFDACHSGQDVRSPVARRLDSNGFARDILQPQTGHGWVTLAACREDQSSYGDPAIGHGIFTHSLVAAIREVAPDTYIYPETLKVALCEKVAVWARERQVQQTPALNGSLIGNVALGIRKPPPSPPAASVLPTEIAEPLDSRIAKLRRFPKIGDDSHKERLAALSEQARRLLANKVHERNWVGGKPGESKLSSTFDMPADVLRILVPSLREAKLRPLHRFSTDTYYKDNSTQRPVTTPFIALLGLRPEVDRVEHHISDSGYPTSYVQATIASDGIVPEAVLFVYVLPLQVSVCVVAGSLLRPAWSNTFKGGAIHRLALAIEDEAAPTRMSVPIDLMLSDTERAFQDDASTMAEYLEWELGQSGLDPLSAAGTASGG